MNFAAGQSTKKIEQLFQQANQLHVQGQLEGARVGYLQVIKAKPKHFDALHLLGVVCCQMRDFQGAVEYINEALRLSPNPVFYYSQGVAYQELGLLEQAEQSYLNALKRRAKYPEALYNLGNLKRAQKNNKEAVSYFDRALAQKPAYTEAHYNKGNALKEMGEYAGAVQSFDQAIALNQSYAQAYLNKGMACKELGQFELALNCYNDALRANPNYADAYSNLGILQTELKRWPEAMRSFQEALSLEPHHAQALWNKSLLLLLHGDFKGGFSLYGTRWREEIMISPALKTDKPWLTPSMASLLSSNPQSGLGGGIDSNTTTTTTTTLNEESHLESAVVPSSANQRLLVWAEQGIGDEIMFGGLLERASTICNKLLVQVDTRLVPLFERSFPNYTFLPKGEPINEVDFDLHMPVGQLAEVFCSSPDAFKSIKPCYLLSDESKKESYKANLPLNGKPIIGISWRSLNDKLGAARSIALGDLVGALSAYGSQQFDPARFNFVNLQYASTQQELDWVKETLGLEVISVKDLDNYSDIDGLAALIDACDAVVSIDNSTVHLAGALGKKTYVLLPLSADWRWGLNAHDSYWYPSVRLFRQSSRGEWAAPLSALRQALLEF